MNNYIKLVYFLSCIILYVNGQIECPKGEIYIRCGTACPPTCENPFPRICTDNCIEGCFCPEGQVRNEKKECVPLKNCTKAEIIIEPIFCIDDLEVFEECGTSCPPTCSKPNPGACNLMCNPGCFCKSGLVRDQNTGKCVKLNDCTCPEGEEFQRCGTACPLTCQRPNITGCTKQCSPGCFCKEGTIRDELSGKCIKPEQCCPKDEMYTECNGKCQHTCNSSICPEICAPGCMCADDKVRGPNGTCINLRECKDCPRNEEYTSCVSHATCQRPFPRPGDPIMRRCFYGCTCKPGFLRDDVTRKCVPKEKCIRNCPRGEIYKSCGSACPKTCEKFKEPQACIALCVEGCFCPDDKVRNKDGRCVYPQECPKEETNNDELCPEDEVFSNCGPACPLTCQRSNQTMCTMQCVPGCFCPKGKIRDLLTGKCVFSRNCKKCPRGELFDECGRYCQPSCYPARPCPAACFPACICPKDKVRGPNGTCIYPKECKLCPKNEEYTDCKAEPTCKDPKAGDRFPRPCIPGCNCKRGLVRDTDTNQCIPFNQCPQTRPSDCKKGEVFMECGQSCLETCSDPEPPCNKRCQWGCFCPPGQVRDDFDQYQCINRTQCPIID